MTRAGRYRRYLALCTLLSLQAFACSRDETSKPRPVSSSNATLDRIIQPTQPRQLWSRGGSATDSLLVYPSLITADDRLLYIIDGGAHKLIAIDAKSGKIAWRSPVADEERGSLIRPGPLSSVPGGGVAVIDQERRVAQFYDQAGRAGLAIELLKLAPTQALCVLRDSSLLLAGAPGPTPLVRVDRAGHVSAWVALPWPDLANVPRIRTQAWLAGDGQGACAATLALGRGFAVYDGTRFGSPSNYVEWFDVPAVATKRVQTGNSSSTSESLASKRVAARDAILRTDQVWVPFQGTSELAGRLVDAYDRKSGNYLHSIVLPERITSAAANGTTLFILTVRDGYPALAAFDVSDR